MEIDLIFRIAILGVLVAIFDIILVKMKREEIAQVITLIAVVFVLSLVINKVAAFFQSVRAMFRL